MYYRLDDGRVMGLLNDSDLSTLIMNGKEDGLTGLPRTGTILFMALDLLGDDALVGEVDYQYKHDFESFLWVLVWITRRYDEGKEIPDPPFGKWLTDHETCRMEKLASYDDATSRKPRLQKPTPSHENVWNKYGLQLFSTLGRLRKREATGGDMVVMDPDEYLNQMKEAIFPKLSNLEVNPFHQTQQA
ncbi:hypothetical protein FRC03_004775 [Tulasnella sp. 419]|nr:hypothetical protein FRC03_004775 [Tulasnella sp. 419]